MRYRKSIASLTAAVLLGGSLFADRVVEDVKQHEGVRTEAYIPLPGDRPTIAAGSTFNPDGSPVRMGQKITREQIDEYIRYDVGRFSKALQKCITVPLNEGEYRAIYSWAMNVGETAACRSTLVRKLNTYDYAGACAELKKWVYFKGQVNRGLKNRRDKEYKTCIGENQ